MNDNYTNPYTGRSLPTPPDIGGSSQMTPTADYRALGDAVMTILRRYQQMGKTQMVAGQAEQVNRGTAELPADLASANLNPNQILGFRQGEVGAVEPTIGGARKLVQEATSGINEVESFITKFNAQQDKERDDARAIVKDALTFYGSSGFDIINPKLLETAGYDKEKVKLAKETLKQQELQLKQEKATMAAAMGGLSPAQINSTINQIAGAFDNEPIVKEYNTISASVRSVLTAGTSPTDDISRIYAFAKVMDPASSVKEGEYDTIQKYATTLLQRYGLKSKRVFSNSGFLTDEAREFINTTLKNRLKTSEAQYSQVSNEYQRQIDDAKAGRPRQITNYQLPETKVINGVTYKKVQGGWQKVQ